MTSPKAFYLSKTNIINALVFVSTLLAFMVGPDFPISLTPETLKWIILAQSVINIGLRFITTGPVALFNKSN